MRTSTTNQQPQTSQNSSRFQPAKTSHYHTNSNANNNQTQNNNNYKQPTNHSKISSRISGYKAGESALYTPSMGSPDLSDLEAEEAAERAWQEAQHKAAQEAAASITEEEEDEGAIGNMTWEIDWSDLTFNDSEDDAMAKGAFGSVYRGLYFGTPVAIKKLNYPMNDPDMQKYIAREMEVLVGVRHPNIVQLLGVSRKPITKGGSEGGELYLVTDFLREGNLRQLLKDKRIPVSWRTLFSDGLFKRR
eukprot:TRINITY_DN1874_c0_g1_i2.p1 TRINITY_DN1874_c0_g1~~TRINITY_DN1874_c0_g1_i2.p1  ORF type:complete len:247 (-),score=64.71 TRINITY_DN1874_c0_g1_i2:28-768(-)